MSRTARFSAAIAALTLVGAVAAPLRPLPLPFSLEVDSSLSKLTFKISTLGGAATTNLSSANPSDGLDGIIDLANYAGNVAGNGSVGNGGASLTIASLWINLDFVGFVHAGLNSVHAKINGGPLSAIGPQLAGNPGQNTYDLGGTALILDAGSITYAGGGPIYGLLGTGTISTPITFTLPSGTNDTVKLTPPGPGGVRGMTLTIPVETSASIITSPTPVDASLSGQIVFTGTRVRNRARWRCWRWAWWGWRRHFDVDLRRTSIGRGRFGGRVGFIALGGRKQR